jgi:hypothetical protein
VPEEELIQIVRRFQERIRNQPIIDHTQLPGILARPPVSAREMSEAESRSGFCLPPLLRALYTQVGDGDYGPGRGLVRLAEGDWSLVKRAERTCIAASANGEAWWPPKLIEFVSWGCFYTTCVDCSGPPFPLWFYDHDQNVGDASLEDYLIPQAESLECWLVAWLDGADLRATGPKSRQPR